MDTTSKKSGLLVLMLLVVSSVFARAIEVTGVVYDDRNRPVPGATIQVKGTTTGTVSDVNGRYRVMARMGDTLVFTFIGYEKKEVKVENTNLDNFNRVCHESRRLFF